MNVVGKILVFANLAFCLITAALISWAYAARTNWHAYARKLEGVIKVVEANADTYRLEAEEAKNKADAQVKQMAEALKRTTTELNTARSQSEQNQRMFLAEQQKNADAKVNVESITRELGTRQEEIDYLNGLKAAQDKKMADLARDNTELRNRAVAAEINSKSDQERNTQLLAQLETLTKEIDRLRAGRSGSLANNVKPPPEDVEGLVKAVDRQTGYVTISIGSDHGLSKGNTLETFRLVPEGRYLGTVKILQVRPNEAVAQPVGQFSSPIQLGDRVASRIGNI
jgi:hypothetical protein